MGVHTKRKRVMLTIDKELYEIIGGLKGFGEKDAEKCLNIIRCYLSEHEFFDDL